MLGETRAETARPAVPRLPSEAEKTLLWTAARVDPDVETVARAAASSDVDYVLEAAARHHVAPLMLRALNAASVRVDPANRVLKLATVWEAHARLALPAVASAGLAPLAAEGLSPVLLKGLAVTDRYPAPGLRPMVDIDVLLPRELIPRARLALRRSGWNPGAHLAPDPGYDIAFRHPSVPGVPLELHYELVRWQERTNGINAQLLWAARRPVTVFGQHAYGLPAELELLVLCVHAAKRFHLFNRMIWMVDLTVVCSAPGFDWERVERLATDARCRVPLAIGLRLARRLGGQVPEELLVLPRFLARSGTLDKLLDPARPFLPTAEAKSSWLSYVIVDDVRGTLRLAIGDLLHPRHGEPRTRAAAQLVRTARRGIRRLGPGLFGASRPR